MKTIICNETRIMQIFIKYLGIAVLALLILFSPAASAALINGTQISGGNSSNPDVYGNKIVWEEIHSNGMDENYFIYMYDISNSKKTEIPGGLSEPCQFDPAIYKNRIVYSDFRNGSNNIYMYDISASRETQISSSGEANSPDIYGDTIVYVNSADQYGICVYNISTRDETYITTSKSALYPAIYDDKVVWQDYRNDGWNIYMYNLSTSKETQISTSRSAYSPAIYGNRIVWEDKGTGSDICMFDLSTSQETLIPGTGGSNPAIYGDRIIWEDMGYYSMTGNGGFGMYNISTGQKISIHTNKPAVNPTIYGDRIVCEDEPEGDWGRIWFYTISEEDVELIFPVANFSTNISSGNVPLSVKFTDLSENVSGWLSG